MMKPIDANRLKATRNLRKLSQEDLAIRANLSKESVYRLEKGQQGKRGVHQATVDKLAKALDVAPGVLTSDLPMPGQSDRDAEVQGSFEKFPMNFRVYGAIRNAFSLASRRYNVPIARIFELAPLLFVLAAEGSLERRTSKLAELQDLFDREDRLRSSFGHLPMEIVPNFRADDAFAAEQESIERHDILAATLPSDIFDTQAIQDDYDEDEHNPFVVALQAEAARLKGVAVVESFGRYNTSFQVCRPDALTLAGGDEHLADSILMGQILIYQMPRDLLAQDATEARVAWLREQDETYTRNMLESLGDISLDFPDLGLPGEKGASA